ncbi:MAG: Na+/H+ antiporter NhaA [Thermoleophilaceae bacterium]
MAAATTPFTGRTAWARNLAAPVRDFLSTETGSAAVLLGATIAALVWANAPWSDTYDSVWGTKLSVNLGSAHIAMDLRHWVNEGLMTFFFLVVGLEAKREIDLGELRERSRIAVPVIAAVGGMLVPVAIYLAFNAGGAASDGWGSAMSTDTAFALGVLALTAPAGATRLRVFLLTAAVFDDLVALCVIAIAYTDHVDGAALLVAAGLIATLFALRYIAFAWRRQVAAVLAVGLWVALFESGIDPIISGLAVGLLTSAYQPSRSELERATELTRLFREQPTPELARSAQLGVASVISPNERLQYRLHPWTSYVIVPMFGLANAGIHIDGNLLTDALTSPITLGIFFGYVVGKPLGIVGASWLATRPMFRGPKLPVTWPGLVGGGCAAGVGFTVSILIASLAFGGERLDQAKIGVLAAAVGATITSWAAVQVIRRLPAPVRARQLSRTAEELLDLSDDVDPSRDHIRGPEHAPVTLLEYGDYECSYCGQAELVIRELLASFGDDLRYVWRNLPLNDVHTHTQTAAEAAEAAAAQGAFWEMHDKLLDHQGELELSDILRYADEIGLDVQRVEDELRRREYAPRIAEDVATADASGVAGTPTFFVNGRRHQGAYDIDTLTQTVRRALRRVRVERKVAA